MAEAAVDLFAEAIAHVEPMFQSAPDKHARLRLLWAAAKNARNLAACDVWEDEFLRIAEEHGLIATIGEKEVRHVLSYAWRCDSPPF